MNDKNDKKNPKSETLSTKIIRDQDMGGGKFVALIGSLNSPSAAPDYYIMSDPGFSGLWMMPNDSGAPGFMSFVLARLEGTLPGLPIPAGVMMHHQKECGQFAETDPMAGYPTTYIDRMVSLGIRPRHLLTLESTAYCVMHDIPLLEAARDSRLFSQREDYAAAAAEISGCFPDLKEKIGLLRAGSVYITFNSDLRPLSISTQGRGKEGFRDYLYRELRKVIPEALLPNNSYVQYDVPDMTGLHYVGGENKRQYMEERLLRGLIDQGISTPTNILHLHNILYCIQHDIPLLSPQAEKAYLREGYYEATKAIRLSAPDIREKLDALQKPGTTRAAKAHHVAALPLPADKTGHKMKS